MLPSCRSLQGCPRLQPESSYRVCSLQDAPKLKVAIVGSGLAGMSTAVELLDQGYEVDIYEQRPFIGGKVASYRDKSGNHIEMGYAAQPAAVSSVHFMAAALCCVIVL